MNSRHPGPRRMRIGGSEQQSADGIRGIRIWVLLFNFLLQKSMVCVSDLRHCRLKHKFPSLTCNSLAVLWRPNTHARFIFAFSGQYRTVFVFVCDLCVCVTKIDDFRYTIVIFQKSDPPEAAPLLDPSLKVTKKFGRLTKFSRRCHFSKV